MKIHIIKRLTGGAAARTAPDPHRALHVDRRFRALPFGREPAPRALSRPSGRYAGDYALRAAGRLHARPAAGRCRRPAAQPARARGATHAGEAPQGGRLWHRADHAADLEIGAGAVFRRHSRAHRLCRRGALFPAQRPALRRAQLPRMVDRCGDAGAAAWRSTAGGMAVAGAQGPAATKPRPGATSAASTGRPARSWRWRRAPSDRRSAGRAPAMRRWPAGSSPTASRSGCWAVPARRRLPRRSSATRGPRSHRQRSARRHPRARRASAAVSNDSGLLHVAAALGTPSIGIFGPTSPWHWAPLNPLAGNHRDGDRARLPALPQAGLPARPPSLHARHRPGRGLSAATRSALRGSRCRRLTGNRRLTTYSSNQNRRRPRRHRQATR